MPPNATFNKNEPLSQGLSDEYTFFAFKFQEIHNNFHCLRRQLVQSLICQNLNLRMFPIIDNFLVVFFLILHSFFLRLVLYFFRQSFVDVYAGEKCQQESTTVNSYSLKYFLYKKYTFINVSKKFLYK